MAKFGRKTKQLVKLAGPGLVTGAADDDPSGIATYTQTGAQFGYGQLWTALFALPLMVAIQEACARIGVVTGKGIAAVIKDHYGKNVLYGTLALVLIANTVNIGADLGAMGAAAKLIFAIGVIGLGLLAVPVLSASVSYAISEAFSWKEGLNLKLKRAHGFYGVITIATVVGLLINFIGINPIQALIFTAVLNGVIAVPLIFLIARIANNKAIMGEYKSGAFSNILVWATFALMAAAAIAMIVTF